MSDLKKYLYDQLEDPAFREIYEEMQPLAEISKALIEARLAKDLTQTDLARLADVDLIDIKTLEDCDGDVSLNTVMKLFRVLGMTLKISF